MMSRKMNTIILAITLTVSVFLLSACTPEVEAKAEAGINSLGKYTPDDPAPWELDQESIVNELAEEYQNKKVSAADRRRLEELQQGYEDLTVQQFLERYKEKCEEDISFNSSVSDLTYQAIYDPTVKNDDFYTSLYFAQQDYYQTYGPENIRDVSYYFGYYRYFGDVGKPYDIMAEKSAHYDIEITYPDKTALTVRARDQRICAAIAAVNKSIDTLTETEWSGDNIRVKLSGLVEQTLKANSDKLVHFKLKELNTWTELEE